MRTTLLLAAVLAHAAAAHPQAPPPPPPSPSQPAADTFFTGVEKFERNASKVTRVENDHNRDSSSTEPNEPRRLSAVYVFGYDGPGQYNPADVEFYRRKLHTPEWNCKTCDHRLKPGETIDACSRPVGSSTESVVIEMRPDKLTFVHTIGKAGHDNNVACSDN